MKGENTSFFGKKIEKFKNKFKKKKEDEDQTGNLETAAKNYPSNGSLQNNSSGAPGGGGTIPGDPAKRGGKHVLGDTGETHTVENIIVNMKT